jgi:hypothetical protein
MSAAQWLAVLLKKPLDLEEIFPGLCGPQAIEAVDKSFSRDELALNDLLGIGLSVITVASGRDWWFTIKLIGGVAMSWPRVNGELVLLGVDARNISLAAWLDATFALFVRICDPRKVNEIINQLMAPPPGYFREIDEEEESAAFLSAMNQAL